LFAASSGVTEQEAWPELLVFAEQVSLPLRVNDNEMPATATEPVFVTSVAETVAGSL
jgi:hypothetical protein